MTNKLVIIQRGESLPFKFDRGGAEIKDWVCNIDIDFEVGGVSNISRIIYCPDMKPPNSLAHRIIGSPGL